MSAAAGWPFGPTYTQVAHTLKARYHMHLAEVDPANYALALAEVPLGISTPANDFNWFHDARPTGKTSGISSCPPERTSRPVLRSSRF